MPFIDLGIVCYHSNGHMLRTLTVNTIKRNIVFYVSV